MFLPKINQAIRKGLFASFTLTAMLSAFSAEDIIKGFAEPKVAPASNEGELAMKGFVVAPGFKLDLFAAEPNLANPVAFSVDEQGRFYVAETFRLHAGVTDIRGHMDWLDEDLATRTVDDRLALMKRHEGVHFPDYEKYSDRIKQIVDTDGDGKADKSTVFADGFNNALDGIGAGVLARYGKVWYTDIPNLWLLEDKNGDGKADERKSLSYGYGLRVGFLGHDLHGLIFGPDGKLYFSIGDRSSHVIQDGKVIGHTDAGTVFRCNPDGSGLEIFAFGLRNPQELAFDEHGNLFTGDNNADGGDKARVVYILEGSDNGWRGGFQFIDHPNLRGPWNSEKLWYPQWEGQAAFMVPPVANLGDGPSGFAYYPGTGMPDKYRGHFFLADFRGGKGSGIHTFAVKTKGAGFELVDHDHLVWECLPTDVGFGTEPGIYFTDWVEGWNMTGKGRIYHVTNEEAAKAYSAAGTKKLIAEGMHGRGLSELATLLAHPDMRVRQDAQFELVERGDKGLKILVRAAQKNSSQLARIHGIWGIGELAAKAAPSDRAEILKPVLKLAADRDEEIRAQVARVAGDNRISSAVPPLMAMLKDSSPHVRMLAATAIGKLGPKEALPAVLDLIRDNADKDPYIRHGAVMALVGIGDIDALVAAVNDNSPAIRMAAVVALRRLDRADVGRFLNDSSPLIVTEAARAINDLPISGAIPELASLADKIHSQDAVQSPPELVRRIANANYRYGTHESAERLAKIATNGNVPTFIRAEAVSDLSDWVHPPGLDHITGLWRPMAGARDEHDATSALKPVLASLLQSGPAPVQIAAAQACARLKLSESSESLATLAKDSSAAAPARVEALKSLGSLHDSRLAEVAHSLQNDPNESLRKEVLKLESQIHPDNALARITSTLEDGTIGEKQNAFAALATVNDPEADIILEAWMDNLIAHKVPKEIQLDIYEAAAKRKSPMLKAKIEQYDASLSKTDPLAPYRMSLAGGNAAEGRKIFFERADATCVRCHKIKGEGGEVGPDLSTIATRQTREYMLESILFPNKQIAKGFETLIVTTKDGGAFAGIVKSENDKELVLNSPEDGIVTVSKAKIDKRTRGLSAMIEGLSAALSKQDLRNLIEFLSSLK